MTTLFIGRFESLLSSNLSLAFFIPIIVYLSDAVGTQTETIFVRNLGKKQIKFSAYLLKELLIGLILGSIFGVLTYLFAFIWLGDKDIATTVGFAMLTSIASATVLSLIVPLILYKENTDPALGAGPFSTVIQDFVSLMIYFAIATWIIY